MPERDLLERATQALRGETRPHGDGLEEALSRLRWAKPKAPRRVRGFVVPLSVAAAVLSGAAAWAGTTGQLQHWVEDLTEYSAWLMPHSANTAASATSSLAARDSRPSVTPKQADRALHPLAMPPELPLPDVDATRPTLESPASLTATPHDVTPRSVTIAPRVPTRRTPSNIEPNAAPPAPPPNEARAIPSTMPRVATADAETAYRRAHRLHFARKDYAAALQAWNEYLTVAPAGDRWLPEARFNRAVALLRLGQRAAARRALEPFSQGVYGGYRRDDAIRLIEQLGTAAP